MEHSTVNLVTCDWQECLLYGEFLQVLRTSPQLLATCLVAGDRLLPDMMHGLVHSMAAGLFGSCLLPEDKVLTLRLLRHLTRLQLVPSDNPRRLLRQKSCAFARLYSEFHEGLFSAKLFLTAALHRPIMQLLVEDEMFLDIDPDKATVRFPPEERLKKFGREGTPEFNSRLQEYRKWTNSCLVAVTKRFVVSLRENMHCFPSGVSWLVRQIADLLSKSGKIEPKEVNAICTDLVFTYFICPAIVNPEPYGITDAPISYVSRFNLIQVAKIVQMLAMTKYEDVDSKVTDLYNMFDKDCVSSLLDAILDSNSGEGDDSPAIADSSKLQGLSRSAALFTEAEIHNLVGFLQTVSAETWPDEDEDHQAVKKQLSELLAQLPLSTTVNGHSTTSGGLKPVPPHSSVSTSPRRGGAGLLGKVCLSTEQGAPDSILGVAENFIDSQIGVSSFSFELMLVVLMYVLDLMGKPRSLSSMSSPLQTSVSSDGSHSAEEGTGEEDGDRSTNHDIVLVVPFNPSGGENIGLLAEQKVLCMEQPSSGRAQLNLSDSQETDGVGPGGVERAESQEKRTRFSLSHDDGSIGNTSDNLEAVSEAASNHSVASSLELENEDQNDNLSDMVSANVSGRGTPNISGRDTPSSQITEGDEGGGMSRGPAGEPRQTLDFPHSSANKQSRSDIDDKFGKFEIKKLIEAATARFPPNNSTKETTVHQELNSNESPVPDLRGPVNQTSHGCDETVSMVSDTWSTDVLASDSETIEQSERNYPPSITESTIQQLTEATQLLDMTETASEAWSTDVLASDSERLTEVDTDDTGSVARSDDTARSEIEAEGRGEPEGGEDTPPSNTQPVTPLALGLALGLGFRPIREDPVGRASLFIPQSPTKVEVVSHPFWNVTGRGGGRADYRRRTVEYVDSSANNMIQQREQTVEYPKAGSLVMTPLTVMPNGPSSTPRAGSPYTDSRPESHLPGPTRGDRPSTVHGAANHTFSRPGTSETIHGISGRSNPVNLETDLKIEEGNMQDAIPGVVRLSSASLASTSSSGSSSDTRPKITSAQGDLPVTAGALVPNGHIVIPEDDPAVAKIVSQSSATGAIPKSISFDKTAERGDKDSLDDDQKHKRGFFRNFKLPFKSRRVKSLRGIDDINTRCYDSPFSAGDGEGSTPQLRLRRGMSEETRPAHLVNDTSDDILAKYRRKPPVVGGGETLSSGEGGPSGQVKVKQPSDERLNIDPANVEASYAFVDAKRKLRMVLSTADLQHVPWVNSIGRIRDSRSARENELVSFLQLQLAEAINLQDRSLIAHLHETLRCIRLFDDDSCRKLFRSLKEDYQKRSPYIAYLVRCRQGLLSTLAHLERLTERVKCDRQVCSRFLVAVCVTLFLEKRESLLLKFTSEFQQLTLADEKNDLLDSFLRALAIEMDRDAMWQVASEQQLEQARTAVERAVVSRVYLHALYPNGDGDMSRDQWPTSSLTLKSEPSPVLQLPSPRSESRSLLVLGQTSPTHTLVLSSAITSVLHEHMKKLSQVITPDHNDLRVPKMFHYECPWPSAQAEIAAISAYKTPRDKLQCVFRCATTIMNLLAMACERGVPAADDFVPVLVYVLIKANPPSLLSTVQYVNSFYGSRLEGEEQYWWIQFCSAIEFIKTMDYND
uniref:Receptor-mediated endocytosis protein 6 homolog n=1 Tax=Timema shepardi TaxID=629360 RepID=A0A7R9B221_TIMSH|nr:unnamed protein product [Timema shepardi]